jgi:hypothetical protein
LISISKHIDYPVLVKSLSYLGYSCAFNQQEKTKITKRKLPLSVDTLSYKNGFDPSLKGFLQQSLDSIETWELLADSIISTRKQKKEQNFAILFNSFAQDATAPMSGWMWWFVEGDMLYMYPASESYVLKYDMDKDSVHFSVISSDVPILEYKLTAWKNSIREHISYFTNRTKEFATVWIPSKNRETDCRCVGLESIIRKSHPWINSREVYKTLLLESIHKKK